MIRDEVGASNVNTPSNIENTTVVNNEYLEEQLQVGLSTKQDKLKAGTNVEITEDNVINVKGDVATDANLVTQTNEALGENVQTALDILNSRYMIPPYYTQYPLENGNFDANEEPSNWYKKMYNITTTWQIMFNSESVYFRTEGLKSSVSRSNGFQPYGMKDLNGQVVAEGHPFLSGAGGVFEAQYQIPYSTQIVSGYNFYQGFIMYTKKQMREYIDDIVVDNYQIRIYKLLTINGKKVSDIIGA